jgi:hypothetical protein
MLEKMKAKMKFRKMMENIDATRQDEFSCDDCFEYMDEYAEYSKQPDDRNEDKFQKVSDHLNKCMDCGEIYRIFVKALKKEGQ